jgi:hypothetical protein
MGLATAHLKHVNRKVKLCLCSVMLHAMTLALDRNQWSATLLGSFTPNSMHLPTICLEGLRKTTKDNPDNLSPGWDLNKRRSGCEAKYLIATFSDTCLDRSNSGWPDFLFNPLIFQMRVELEEFGEHSHINDVAIKFRMHLLKSSLCCQVRVVVVVVVVYLTTLFQQLRLYSVDF